MSKNTLEKDLIKRAIKTSFLTINVLKTSSRSKYKNLKLSNRKIHQETDYKKIVPISIKGIKRKLKS